MVTHGICVPSVIAGHPRLTDKTMQNLRGLTGRKAEIFAEAQYPVSYR